MRRAGGSRRRARSGSSRDRPACGGATPRARRWSWWRGGGAPSQTSSSRRRRETTAPGRAASAARRSNSFAVSSISSPSRSTRRASASTVSAPTRSTPRPAAPARRATCDGIDAGEQLAKAERLDQVVVGTELEADDAVDLVSARADDDDRHARAGAQLAAHLEAVAVGEAQVEQHEIVLGRRDGIRRVRDPRDVEPLALQPVRERLGDRLLILDKQDPHGVIVTERSQARSSRTWHSLYEPQRALRDRRRPRLSTAGHSVDSIDQELSPMKTVHALSIALLLGLAAALGGLAATRTVTASHAQAAGAAPATDSIASRTDARSTAGSASLQRALHRRPPEAAELVHFARVVAPAGARSGAGLAQSRRAGAAHDLRPRQGPACLHTPASTSTSTSTKAERVATMTNHVARLYALATLADRLLRRLARGLGPPVVAEPNGRDVRRRPADRTPERARASSAGRDAQGQPDRQAALRGLPHGARPSQPRQCRGARTPQRPAGRSAPGRPRRPAAPSPPAYASSVAAPAAGAHRHPAPGRRDEDVVTLLRHTFRAMGTDIECLLERPHDAVAEQALADAEAEFARLEAALSRFLPDSELSRLNAAGEAARRPRPPRARRGGRRGPRAHRRALRPDRPRRPRRRGLRPLVRAPRPPVGQLARRRRTMPRAHGPSRCGGEVQDRSRALARDARSPELASISEASPRATRPTA